MRPVMYSGTDIFIVCFAVDSRNAFENVAVQWVGEVSHHCPDKPLVLVATKCDLRKTSSQVISTKEGEALADRIGACAYMETSAHTGQGVKELFRQAAVFVVKGVEKPKKKKKKSGCSIL